MTSQYSLQQFTHTQHSKRTHSDAYMNTGKVLTLSETATMNEEVTQQLHLSNGGIFMKVSPHSEKILGGKTQYNSRPTKV